MSTCACGCGPFTPTKRRPKFKTRQCSLKHYRSVTREERVVRRATHPRRHPRTAAFWEMRAEMDAAGGKGRCIFCEGPLPRGRRLHCGSPGPDGCEADYQHMYHLAEVAERSEREPSSPPKQCKYPGCTDSTRMGGNGRMTAYCSDDHQRRFNWELASRARSEERARRRGEIPQAA